jgi:hypothetical protein
MVKFPASAEPSTLDEFFSVHGTNPDELAVITQMMKTMFAVDINDKTTEVFRCSVERQVFWFTSPFATETALYTYDGIGYWEYVGLIAP